MAKAESGCGHGGVGRCHLSVRHQVIHRTLGEGIQNDGFDPKRAVPGICIQRKGDGLSQLIAWNERFSIGDLRFPRIDLSKLNKGSIAGTHLNLSLRCFRHGVVSLNSGFSKNRQHP